MSFCPLLLVSLMTLLYGAATAAPQTSPLEEAEAQLAAGEYRTAHRLLEKAMRDKGRPLPERMNLMRALAAFYEEQVGDDRRAMKTWRRILAEGSAGANHRDAAQVAIDRIQERLRRSADMEKRLGRMRVAAMQPGRRGDAAFRAQMSRQYESLRAMEAGPETAAGVQYTLGLTLSALDRPFGADRAFGRVLQHRPAYGLFQPIQRLRQTARQRWVRRLLQRTAGVVLVAFWLAVSLGTILTRPWRWARWRHLAAGIILALAWVAIFQVNLRLPGRQEVAAFVNRDGFYPMPTYVHTRPGTPESEIAERLLMYGLTAIAGMFLLAVATTAIGCQKKRQLVGGLTGLVFALALMTHFYYAHCENQSRLYRRNATAGAWLSAQLAFRSTEPEPYLLTDPRAYAGVELASISDPLLVAWLERHVPDARRQSEKRRNN